MSRPRRDRKSGLRLECLEERALLDGAPTSTPDLTDPGDIELAIQLSATPAQVQSVLSSVGGQVVDSKPELNYYLIAPPSGSDQSALVAMLNANPLVSQAAPNVQAVYSDAPAVNSQDDSYAPPPSTGQASSSGAGPNAPSWYPHGTSSSIPAMSASTLTNGTWRNSMVTMHLTGNRQSRGHQGQGMRGYVGSQTEASASKSAAHEHPRPLGWPKSFLSETRIWHRVSASNRSRVST